MLRRLITYSLLSTLLLGTLGQLLRDRTLLLMLLMFVPLQLIACAALAWDLWHRGRALHVRWLLSGLAIATAAYSVTQQWQPARAAEAEPHTPLRIVQWNTQWGGRSHAAFERIVDTLHAQRADLMLLSEAPELTRLRRAWKKRQPDWYSVALDSGRGQSYWYSLAVLSRYPVQLSAEWTLSRGHSALFEVAWQSRPVRVLMVDLHSSPLSPRSPSLREVAGVVDARAHTNQPIDVVLGDFNTPARLLGFDTLAAAGGGMRRAALWSGDWRGTWPSFVPFAPYDIDHIWVSKRWSMLRASFFSCLGTDHRGQAAELQPAR